MQIITFTPADKYPLIGSPSTLFVHDSICEETGMVITCVLPCELTGMVTAAEWAGYWILKASCDSERFNAQFR